ncbi:DMP19 family protein [Allorhodopirellula heiligendammensis]|uniref:DNA mimic protein DMP19 C-terminal domain-containing protein n=1 Tax=Allorhodopirellula heiligendammensis TaxID=2714739 RepID=A0A5C6B1J2_9BACT|nr:DUF4375 domain-containing protein [Allorhodopirellula heiligendammensis]TWU05339.1 hypothetical protein Poly21_57530 [Allorhodopirellula heiligendammensis]
MSEIDERLAQQLDAARQKLKAVGNDVGQLLEPYRTLILVESAQGVIDNGGLIYFFEMDWPGCPPYRIFSDAYRRIGLDEAAEDIDNAAKSFGFEFPERFRERRQEFMDKQFGTEDDDGEEIDGLWEVQWTDRICGNDSVWQSLSLWASKNGADVG